ncbi:hypothetical protein N0V85_003946 [Neurospora sp. IMI 360204]|nr:hypothetical protein N0V85_003946 [Neurospora sp. IMI 360204]
MPDRSRTYPTFRALHGHEEFPRLPREVRLHIWEMTVEPRIIEVRVEYSKKDFDDDVVTARFNKVSPEEGDVFPLFSSTPVPAPLQACREARNRLGGDYYQKAFHDLPAARHAGEELELDQKDPKQRTESPPNLDKSEPRKYVWINFTLDMLSLGPSLFHHFSTYSSKIKALRFQRDLDEEVVDLSDLRRISSFVNVKELRIVCAYGQDVQDWAGVETELEMKFPIPRWDVLVIAPRDDLIVDAYEIDIYNKE